MSSVSRPGALGRSPRRRSRQRAFTLVELLVVLSTISIMVTIAIPSFTSMGKRRVLRANLREVSRLLSLARSRAVASRKFVAVEIELNVYPEPDRVRILENATWDSDAEVWVGSELPGMNPYLLVSPIDLQQVIVGNTTIFTGVHAIVFSPVGSAGWDDGSQVGGIDIDIVRMDA